MAEKVRWSPNRTCRCEGADDEKRGEVKPHRAVAYRQLLLRVGLSQNGHDRVRCVPRSCRSSCNLSLSERICRTRLATCIRRVRRTSVHAMTMNLRSETPLDAQCSRSNPSACLGTRCGSSTLKLGHHRPQPLQRRSSSSHCSNQSSNEMSCGPAQTALTPSINRTKFRKRCSANLTNQRRMVHCVNHSVGAGRQCVQKTGT